MRVKPIVVAFAAYVFLIACVAGASCQAALPEDARQVLRRTITELEALARQHADSAVTIQQEVRRLRALVDSAPSVSVSPGPSSPGLGGFRDQVGKTFRVKTKGTPVSNQAQPVWGTDTYTDDSDLSAAAVHAGLLAPGQEGEVLITFVAGLNQYPGSIRNGVTTNDWGSWPGAFRLSRLDASAASVPVLPPPAISSPVVNAVSAPGLPPIPGDRVDDQTLWQALGGQVAGSRANASPNLTGLRNRVGDSFEFEVTGSTSGSVWGDGTYTDDSDLSAAAVHAGVLNAGERGRVRVTILAGIASYNGVPRNGVVSQPFGQWQGSYRIERANPR